MSTSNAISAGLPVVRGDYSFPKLRRSQVGELLEKWSNADKAELVQLLADAGADAATKMAKLGELYDRVKLWSYAIAAVYERRKALDVLIASIGKDAVDTLPFSDMELRQIAGECLGYDLEALEREATGTVTKNEVPPLALTGCDSIACSTAGTVLTLVH